MDLTEIKQQSEKIYEGAIIDVDRDVVSLPDGNVAYREIVRHPGGACVCALDGEFNVYLVRQYRYAYESELLELPAGKVDDGEEPEETALRELKEEAGLETPEKLLHMGEMYPSPGFTDEVIDLFVAFNVVETGQQPDADEFLYIEKMPFVKCVEMVLSNEIKDAKTQACVLKTYLLLMSTEAQMELEREQNE